MPSTSTTHAHRAAQNHNNNISPEQLAEIIKAIEVKSAGASTGTSQQVDASTEDAIGKSVQHLSARKKLTDAPDTPETIDEALACLKRGDLDKAGCGEGESGA